VCRSAGTFAMVLQQLVSSGQLRVSDCLLDDNNIVLKVLLRPVPTSRAYGPCARLVCTGLKPAVLIER